MFVDYGLDRDIPKSLKISLTRGMAGKLIGNRGETISKIRREYPHVKIIVSKKDDYHRYVHISGDKLLQVYGKMMTIIR